MFTLGVTLIKWLRNYLKKNSSFINQLKRIETGEVSSMKLPSLAEYPIEPLFPHPGQ